LRAEIDELKNDNALLYEALECAARDTGGCPDKLPARGVSTKTGSLEAQ